jgi:hypothetical protein
MKKKYILTLSLALSSFLFAEGKQNSFLKLNGLIEEENTNIDALFKHKFENNNFSFQAGYKSDNYEYHEDTISEREGDIVFTEIEKVNYFAMLNYSHLLTDEFFFDVGVKYSKFDLKKIQKDNYQEDSKDYRLDHTIILDGYRFSAFVGLVYQNKDYFNSRLKYSHITTTDMELTQETNRIPKKVEGGIDSSTNVSFDSAYQINADIEFYTSKFWNIPFDIKLKGSKAETPYLYPLQVFNPNGEGYIEKTIDDTETIYTYAIEAIIKASKNLNFTVGYERVETEIVRHTNSEDIEKNIGQDKGTVGMIWTF